jgi:AraC family transcriptional regulator, transcriptional activator of pobA
MKDQVPVYSICDMLAQNTCNCSFLIVDVATFLSQPSAHLVFPHKHSFYQLFWIRHGSGTHTIDFKTYDIQANMFFLLSPGQVHSWELSDDIDGYLISFDAELFSSAFQNLNCLTSFPFFDTLMNKPFSHIKTAALVAEFEGILSACMQEQEHFEQKYKADLFRSLLMQVLIKIARNYTQQPNGPIVTSHANLLVREYEQLIHKHFLTKKKPKEYAELLNITANHLNSVCKNSIDKSAGELIRERILLEAKRLLAHSTYQISEIAYRLSFEDNAYFSRFFKKYTEQTPEQFRKASEKTPII